MLDLVEDHPMRKFGHESCRVVRRRLSGNIVIETDVVVPRASTNMERQRTLPTLTSRPVDQYRRGVLQRFHKERSNMAFV